MQEAIKPKRTLLEVLDELDDLVRGSDEPKSWAIFAMGHAIGLAATTGWTVDELVRMGLVAPSQKVTMENETEARCACGLHTIAAGVHGVNWYWAVHTRKRCSLDLPNVRCWCGRLRSEHQDEHGHEPGARDAHGDR